MYKESVAAPNPHDCSIADSAFDFMKTYEVKSFVKTQKYAPDTVSSGWGAKTGSVFDCGKMPASRSYAAGGARYLRTDLMLLTHAKYAFKDPRGRFGISCSACTLTRSDAGRWFEISLDEQSSSL